MFTCSVLLHFFEIARSKDNNSKPVEGGVI